LVGDAAAWPGGGSRIERLGRAAGLTVLVLLASFAAVNAAHAAIGTPVDLGTASSKTTGTSLTLTLASAVAAGNSIIVTFAMNYDALER
jgi:hypothetical protein